MDIRQRFITLLEQSGEWNTAAERNRFGSHIKENWLYRDCMDKLKYIPDETMESLVSHIDTVLSKVTSRFTFAEVMTAADELGYLKFEPYLAEGLEPPTLVLRYNRFAHLFRGYYFQVSYSANGVGAFNTPYVNASYIRNAFGGYTKSTAFCKLLYMNCIETCNCVGAFRRLINYGNTDLIDEFVRKSIEYFYGIETDITYAQISGLMTAVQALPEGELTTLRVVHNDMQDRIRIYLTRTGDFYIEGMKRGVVEITKFSMPDFTEGLSADDFEDMYDVQNTVKVYQNNPSILMQCIIAALCMMDIPVSTYAIGLSNVYVPMRAINLMDVVTINGVHDIYNILVKRSK